MKDVVIACVGKPSAGKSSFLNSVTDATAKVGNYPFTTIRPNYGIGKCVNGKRFVPIQIMDVAGLVPGASEGQGLGNQFLDDLRHANALIHVVDVSGTTDASGKETIGYDPIGDIEWLRSEIHSWIFGNIFKKWPQIALNKVDLPDSDKNISKIMRKYGQSKVVLSSALAESFLKKMHKQKFIRYEEGTDIVETLEDLPDSDLKPLDEKIKSRIEKVQDLVLYRYGSTGVQDVVLKAVEVLGLVPTYPVKSLTTFGNAKVSSRIVCSFGQEPPSVSLPILSIQRLLNIT
ncbi:hypothetical protein BGW38_002479 [Lunasporangiospora selenospora]|uniref:OBG-type G domain-containing protein n=1 Tax=Lunasporangiospora selenospora TaxID=979761 RepID=A0A9P6FU35_9FUNG|nr:hypothetical protein BGW38_002479 [Lunasporangiospora selenospora]